jgi:peptide/nickel transport system substrate-binding protein
MTSRFLSDHLPSRLSRLAWGTLLSAVLLAAGLVHAQADASTPKRGGTVVVGISTDPPTLDTLHGNLQVTRVTSQICENLVAEDPASAGSTFSGMIPGLATSWVVSDDGLTYTFDLRRGVSFSDGEAFNAAAMVANFDRVLNSESPYYSREASGHAQAGRLLSRVARYEAVDDFTFVVTLSTFFPDFLLDLRHRVLGVVSPAAIAAHGNAMSGEHLACTGPFMFAQRDIGSSITLVPNPTYWASAERGPYIDRLIFQIIPDPSTRIAALLRGDIDIDVELPPERVPGLIADPGVTVEMSSAPHVWYWGLNYKSELMQDERVRQAIWHALDTATMVETLYGDAAVPMDSILPPGNPGYRPDFQRPYPYDPAAARALLEEAGFASGLALSIHVPLSGGSYMDSVAMAQWAQANLAEVGITATIQTYELGTWVPIIIQGAPETVDMFGAAWQSIAYSPLMLESLFASTAHRPNGFNDTWFVDEELDALLAEARTIVDMEERVAAYHVAEDHVLRAAAAVPVAHDRQPRAHRANLRGVAFIPSPWFDLTSVWIE